MIIGLTGGIASGKSTVSKMFRELGATIIDADVIAREVVEKGSSGLQEIVATFGTEILATDGSLDRARLGAIVFGDEDSRLRLNQIVHPRVRARFEALTQEAVAKDPNQIVIHDVPLLYENGLDKTVEKVVVVSVSDDTQIHRLMERNHFSKAEAQQRIAAQMPIREKVKRADYVIDNEGSLDDAALQVHRLWNTWIQGRNT